MRLFRSTAALLLILSFSPVAPAFETDQYNLPPVPLGDIGEEVTDYVQQNLVAAVDELNHQIGQHQACLEVGLPRVKNCQSPEREQEQLAALRSEAAVANAVYERLGKGSLFITRTGKWFQNHKFHHDPDRYKASYKESVFVFMPLDYATVSPTVRLYGVELGWDKIEHFFQQGYKYFNIVRDESLKGRSNTEAETAAVRWGSRTENTYFGLLVSGVYSNGDLAANYAGMKFYEGLTHRLAIGEWSREPLLQLRDGTWQIRHDGELRELLLKPFISEHMNEALNPSVYSFNLYPTVKRVVTTRSCSEWQDRYPEWTRDYAETFTAKLAKWHDQDYGWKKGDRMVPITLCFDSSRKSR